MGLAQSWCKGNFNSLRTPFLLWVKGFRIWVISDLHLTPVMKMFWFWEKHLVDVTSHCDVIASQGVESFFIWLIRIFLLRKSPGMWHPMHEMQMPTPCIEGRYWVSCMVPWEKVVLKILIDSLVLFWYLAKLKIFIFFYIWEWWSIGRCLIIIELDHTIVGPTPIKLGRMGYPLFIGENHSLARSKMLQK